MAAILLASSFIFLVAPGAFFTSSSTANPCQLANGIQHVIYIQFDNVHFTRDNPNVPSDLEQMPALLNFMEQNGVIATNQQTPMLSHTADDIVTSITGLYGDQQGIPVANDYGYYSNGTVNFQSSFAYWTDRLNPIGSGGNVDTTYNLLTSQGLNTPAPWVAYTRAGCNFGGVAMANTELENLFPDVPTVFGTNSSQAKLASSNPNLAAADFEGLSVHCAASNAVCSGMNGGVKDVLPDEPGGYYGFNALFGAKYIDPIISPSGPMRALNGTIITDGMGNVGFPGYDGMAATVSLAYVAAMQEHGISITYAYISDAHDNNPDGTAFGPGQAGYEATLKAYNTAFAEFFARLQKDGITKKNTLFVFDADEGDHFVGGPPSPPNCDGVTIPCTYSKIGEIDTNLQGILAVEKNITTPFAAFYNAAPVIYIYGNPGPNSSTVRTFEQASENLSAYNPYSGTNLSVTDYLANPVEMNLMHMITGDPDRTPTFTLYGNDNLYMYTGGDNCSGGCTYVDSVYAWNHGDIQPQITTTWVGFVGPDVNPLGIDSVTFSDHADIRPTMMMMLGLKDDYTYEGAALVQYVRPSALPKSIRSSESTFVGLYQVLKQINAPVGMLGRESLNISTVALSGNSTTYDALENQLLCITNIRNNIASQILSVLYGAEFDKQSINSQQASDLTIQANNLLLYVQHLNEGGSPGNCMPSYSGSNDSRSSSNVVQLPSSSSSLPTIPQPTSGNMFSISDTLPSKK